MKYDAGMTQYHDDIVSALRDMLHGEIDKIAELAAEGSPVPLREYLRNNHGKKSHGGNKFDAMSSCFLVIFDHVINNEGDSKLNLSWSQVATFIRKYPSDFFKKNDDKETFPCDDCGYDRHGCCNYPDTPDDYCVMGNKKTSLGIDELDLDVRTFNAFKRAGINTVEDYLNYPDKDKLRSVVGNRNFEKFLAASKPAELPTVQPERAAEVSESFNYAVLTAELGDYLKHMEEKLRNEYMNFTANCGRIFVEAQEKLAGDNQYNGMFEKWITAMGFKKSTVYEMIRIHQFRSSEIRTTEQAQLFDSLSKSLQYEVAKPSAPPKLVEQVMNGDITTHKEYIELKKQLDEAKENLEMSKDDAQKAKERADEAEKKAAFWSKTSAETSKENQQLRADRVSAMNRADNAERELSEAQAKIEKLNREADEADREYDAMADRECHYETEICELEQRIKELENRPVDVAVDVDELNRRVAEVTNKMNSEMEHTLAEERRGFADTLNAKDDRIWELEDELAELRDHNTELDFGDGSNSLSADQLSEIYETLHGKVISALKDCKAFISINNLPQIVKDRASGKFGTLKELIEWYIEEME
jgi:predicted  nucleic acid-binding Zn-ribbon protein